jgi:hypothetical protein
MGWDLGRYFARRNSKGPLVRFWLVPILVPVEILSNVYAGEIRGSG